VPGAIHASCAFLAARPNYLNRSVLLGVTRIRVEDQVGRMAVVKLGMPDVLVIDEENRKRAVGNVGDGALAIPEVRELGAAVLAGVHVGILKEKHNNLVAGVVVDIHLFAFMLVGATDSGQSDYGGSKGEGEQRLTQFHW
jgi:hypothetical protein